LCLIGRIAYACGLRVMKGLCVKAFRPLHTIFHNSNGISTVYPVAQLSVGTFEVSVGQNGVRMRDISELPSNAIWTFLSLTFVCSLSNSLPQ